MTYFSIKIIPLLSERSFQKSMFVLVLFSVKQYLILGPQDLSYEDLIASLRDSEDGFHYLQHEALTITSPSGREWRIYGSPVSNPPPSFRKSFFLIFTSTALG
jgi:hypothetical protein